MFRAGKTCKGTEDSLKLLELSKVQKSQRLVHLQIVAAKKRKEGKSGNLKKILLLQIGFSPRAVLLQKNIIAV